MRPAEAFVSRRRLVPRDIRSSHDDRAGVTGINDGGLTMATAKDPVCAMEIEEGDAVGSADHQGKSYYFCSEDCREEFEADPSAYVD